MIAHQDKAKGVGAEPKRLDAKSDWRPVGHIVYGWTDRRRAHEDRWWWMNSAVRLRFVPNEPARENPVS